jgi:transglutaminase-like putative cysteine protease
MTSVKASTDIESFLAPTEYLDADHPRVRLTVQTLVRGASSDTERVGRIYCYVRDLPYDILASFRYLAQGQHAASDVLHHGVAFCMGKAGSFVALCRAAGVPARIAFQTLQSTDMEFLAPEVRALWGGKSGRPLPWHSLGEAYLGGRWVKLDGTIDAPTAARLGRPYWQEFDGITDIPTVEGPIVRENGSYADYPAEVAQWYERIARSVLKALQVTQIHTMVAADDELWAGPALELVARKSVSGTTASSRRPKFPYVGGDCAATVVADIQAALTIPAH